RFALPATGVIPPGMLGHDPGRRRQTLSLPVARELVTRATTAEAPVRLRAAASPGLMDRYGALVENLFELWRALGVEVSITTTTVEQYLAALHSSAGYDLLVCRWNADY